MALLSRHRARTWHVHFKDCEPHIAERGRRERLDYQTALRHGLFCELGRGSVDFPGLLRDLQDADYDGWIVVEQDVLPAMGSPVASATRNPPPTSIITTCGAPVRCARNSVCPVKAMPASLMTLFCSGAVTRASNVPARQPSAAASSVRST